MYSLLEQYLNEVAKRLSPLPVARRNEELREMRQHLLNAVIINREMGQSEDEAVVNAVEQFGTPRELCDNLVWAWQRERSRDRRNLWRAVVAAPMLVWSLILLDNYSATGLLHLVWPSCNVFLSHHTSICRLYVHGLFFLDYGLTGAVLGGAMPKQAVRGICLGLCICECGYLIWLGHPLVINWGTLPYYAEDLARTLIGISVAWMMSRLQAGECGRARQA